MNETLSVFIGQAVEITSVGASTRFTDIGLLEAFDDPWLRLRTHTGDILCFSVHNIRLIKLIGRTADPAAATDAAEPDR